MHFLSAARLLLWAFSQQLQIQSYKGVKQELHVNFIQLHCVLSVVANLQMLGVIYSALLRLTGQHWNFGNYFASMFLDLGVV